MSCYSPSGSRSMVHLPSSTLRVGSTWWCGHRSGSASDVCLADPCLRTWPLLRPRVCAASETGPGCDQSESRTIQAPRQGITPFRSKIESSALFGTGCAPNAEDPPDSSARRRMPLYTDPSVLLKSRRNVGLGPVTVDGPLATFLLALHDSAQFDVRMHQHDLERLMLPLQWAACGGPFSLPN